MVSLEGFDRVIEKMASKSNSDALAISTQAETETQAAHNQYDADTQHGRIEGADLNRPIE